MCFVVNKFLNLFQVLRNFQNTATAINAPPSPPIYKFSASQIWNADETGASTVVRPNKVVAAKGKQNVGAMTSGKRGTNVTVVTAISASRNTVPPTFVFRRKNYSLIYILKH